MRHNLVNVIVTILEKRLVLAALGSRGRSAGNINSRDVGFHRFFVVHRPLHDAGQFHPGQTQQGLVLLVTDQTQDVVGVDVRNRSVLVQPQTHAAWGNLDRGCPDEVSDSSSSQQAFDLRQQPVFDPFFGQRITTVAEGNLGSGMMQTQRGFNRAVASTDDQNVSAKVSVCLAKITINMWQVFTGDASGEVQTEITSPDATVLIAENKAVGHNGILITNRDFKITGQNWTWHGNEDRVSIETNVEVTFFEGIGDILK